MTDPGLPEWVREAVTCDSGPHGFFHGKDCLRCRERRDAVRRVLQGQIKRYELRAFDLRKDDEPTAAAEFDSEVEYLRWVAAALEHA